MPPSIETHALVDTALDALRRNGHLGLIAACELDQIVFALVGVEPKLREVGSFEIRLAVSGWIAKNQINRPTRLRGWS
jgi:hypothetical protein